MRGLMNKIFHRDAVKFVETYDAALSMEHEAPELHPLQKVYALSPEKAETFLRGYASTGLFSPSVSRGEDGATIIQLDQPGESAVEALQRELPDVQYLELACFQKFYKDKYSNFAKDLMIKGAYGQTSLFLNNIGALGLRVLRDQRVNLFVGASETFECSLRPIGDSAELGDWVAETEVPFNEMGNNINGAIEGAHFPLIIQRAQKLKNAIIRQGAIIENLFVYGGWHNLIYNENNPDAWRSYFNQCMGLAPRTLFYQVTSPVLHCNFEEIKAFCDKGFAFWGYMDCTEENYQALKSKISEYNACLSSFCEETDGAIMIPVDRFLSYEGNEIDTYFRDVNHFSRNPVSRESLIVGLNRFLSENSEFFAPQLGNVSEYIYPTF